MASCPLAACRAARRSAAATVAATMSRRSTVHSRPLRRATVATAAAIVATGGVQFGSRQVFCERPPDRRELRKSMSWQCSRSLRSRAVANDDRLKKIATVINDLVDLDCFTEEQEQELFECAVADTLEQIARALPPPFFDMLHTTDSWLDEENCKDLGEQLVELCLEECPFPYLDEQDKRRIIRAVVWCLVEGMKEGKTLAIFTDSLETDTTAQEVIVNVFIAGAMDVFFDNNLRKEMVSDISETVNVVPFMPGKFVEVVIDKVLIRFRDMLRNCLTTTFTECKTTWARNEELPIIAEVLQDDPAEIERIQEKYGEHPFLVQLRRIMTLEILDKSPCKRLVKSQAWVVGRGIDFLFETLPGLKKVEGSVQPFRPNNLRENQTSPSQVEKTEKKDDCSSAPTFQLIESLHKILRRRIRIGISESEAVQAWQDLGDDPTSDSIGCFVAGGDTASDPDSTPEVTDQSMSGVPSSVAPNQRRTEKNDFARGGLTVHSTRTHTAEENSTARSLNMPDEVVNPLSLAPNVNFFIDRSTVFIDSSTSYGQGQVASPRGVAPNVKAFKDSATDARISSERDGSHWMHFQTSDRTPERLNSEATRAWPDEVASPRSLATNVNFFNDRSTVYIDSSASCGQGQVASPRGFAPNVNAFIDCATDARSPVERDGPFRERFNPSDRSPDRLNAEATWAWPTDGANPHSFGTNGNVYSDSTTHRTRSVSSDRTPRQFNSEAPRTWSTFGPSAAHVFDMSTPRPSRAASPEADVRKLAQAVPPLYRNVDELKGRDVETLLHNVSPAPNPPTSLRAPSKEGKGYHHKVHRPLQGG